MQLFCGRLAGSGSGTPGNHIWAPGRYPPCQLLQALEVLGPEDWIAPQLPSQKPEKRKVESPPTTTTNPPLQEGCLPKAQSSKGPGSWPHPKFLCWPPAGLFQPGGLGGFVLISSFLIYLFSFETRHMGGYGCVREEEIVSTELCGCLCVDGCVGERVTGKERGRETGRGRERV